MGDSTSIEWTDATWNPIRGCSRVSAGCTNCYAERVAARFSGKGQPYEGLAKMTKSGPRWTGKVIAVDDHLGDPLRWDRPRRIFVNSMSDLFHEGLTNWQIAAVFGVMAAAPRHTFQVLTKRADRMRAWFKWLEELVEPKAAAWSAADCDVSIHEARAECMYIEVLDIARERFGDDLKPSHPLVRAYDEQDPKWPLPNVWLGVSTENQATADERIPLLLDTPAAVRFISAEPLLGPLVLTGSPGERGGGWLGRTGWHGDAQPHLQWVIIGCESGPGARPLELAWVRSLRQQCDDHGVAFFLKQATPSAGMIEIGEGSHAKNRGDVIAAPYLDGKQHLEFPDVEAISDDRA
jgi:protein gp37